MNGKPTLGLIGLGLALAAGLVLGSALVGRSIEAVKRQNQALEVKGFAERSIDSDFATWTGSFTTRAPALQEAYAKLERSRAAVLSLLESEGVPEAARELLPVNSSPLFRRDVRGHPSNEIEGYLLTQEVQVGSADVDLVARISKRAADLLQQGVELSSQRPAYLYTKLGELKIEMLGEATADARLRAETIARESGAEIGRVVSARQGVFQITPAHSTEVANYGRNDTSTREKAIKAVVTIRFSLED